MNEFPMEYDTVILVPSALELEIDGRLMDVFKQVKARADKMVNVSLYSSFWILSLAMGTNGKWVIMTSKTVSSPTPILFKLSM